MLKRILILLCGVALFSADVRADSHEEGEGRRDRPRHPHLMIPLPPDVELPPREDGPEAFVEAAVAALDRNENGALDVEEIVAAMKKMREHMEKRREHRGDEGDHDGDGGDDDHEGHDHDGDDDDHGDDDDKEEGKE